MMHRYMAPAEEAPHTRTWMCWPRKKDIYQRKGRPDGYHDDVISAIGRLAAAIAVHEPVTMCASPDQQDAVRAACGSGVEIAAIPTDDMWARDSGPVFVTDGNGNKAGVSFNFNAWGGKERLPADALLAARILDHIGVPQITASITGEGGGIEYDGEGTLLLTESCWVNGNRNPGLSRDEIERDLRRVLGVEQVIWLRGVAGEEETDGHIDGYVRFIRPGLILMSGADRDNISFGDDTIWDEDYRDTRNRLRAARDAAGRRFEIVELPWAQTSRSTDPDFFTSYANFYVGNGAVYSPHFGDDKTDCRAEATLAELFPGREVVMLNVDRIYENGGGIHCVTQQEPA
ncbi:MAG: agmatine deiminase family protein [Pseudomonadota bacterium]